MADSGIGEDAPGRAASTRSGVAATVGVYCVAAAVAGVVLALGVLRVVDMFHLFD